MVKCPARSQPQKEDNTQHSMVKINVHHILWSNVQLFHNNRKRAIFSGQMSSFSTATERGQYPVVKCPAFLQQQKEGNILWSNVQLFYSNRKRTIFSGQMSSSSTATEREQYSMVKCPALPQRQKEDNTQWSNVQLFHSDRKRTILNGQMSSSSTATERGQYSMVKCPARSQPQKEDNIQHSMVKINVQLVQSIRKRTILSGQMSSSSTATERGQHSMVKCPARSQPQKEDNTQH